jgi:hypothetical protein
MSAAVFDLGLAEEDELAMREARLRPFVIDREAALRLMSDAGTLVAEAVRRRPLLSGAPFSLPGYEDSSD